MIYEYRGRRFDVTKFFDLNPIVPEPPPATPKQLQVDSVDLKLTENRTAHFTDKYEVTDLILRRGQEFKIALKLNRPFKKGDDVISVEFRTGWYRDWLCVVEMCRTLVINIAISYIPFVMLSVKIKMTNLAIASTLILCLYR